MNKIYEIKDENMKGYDNSIKLFFQEKDIKEILDDFKNNKRVFAKFDNKYFTLKESKENVTFECYKCYFCDPKYMCSYACRMNYYFEEIPEYRMLFGEEGEKHEQSI